MHHVWGLVSTFNKMTGISFTKGLWKNQIFVARCCRCDRYTSVCSVVWLPLTIVEHWKVVDRSVIGKWRAYCRSLWRHIFAHSLCLGIHHPRELMTTTHTQPWLIPVETWHQEFRSITTNTQLIVTIWKFEARAITVRIAIILRTLGGKWQSHPRHHFAKQRMRFCGNSELHQALNLDSLLSEIAFLSNIALYRLVDVGPFKCGVA